MARIDLHCPTCDQITEVDRPAAMWPAVPPCPLCASTDTVQMHLPRGVRDQVDPVVVYRAPDGTFRYPGDTNGLSAHKYDKAGYERIEARGFAEVRRLTSRINEVEGAHTERANERRLEAIEAGERRRRSDLFHAMGSMSNLGKAVGRAMVDRNNQKPRRTSGGRLIVEAYE